MWGYIKIVLKGLTEIKKACTYIHSILCPYLLQTQRGFFSWTSQDSGRDVQAEPASQQDRVDLARIQENHAFKERKLRHASAHLKS